VVRPWLRFHLPLIEPDRRLSRIWLSDKISRLRPRHVAPERGQAYEPEVPVTVREWIRTLADRLLRDADVGFRHVEAVPLDII
jgi:hypothetical protein